MEQSIKIGISFGLTSGIVTTLGLIVGLNAGTSSEMVVVGGILTIAIADSASDALGIHISQESDPKKSIKEIWMSTIATFSTKLVFALSFIIPVVLLELNTAVIVSIIWGLLLLSIFSYYIAVQKGESPWRAILEHTIIAVLVIISTNFAGDFIHSIFS
ncbi:hypothetical protein J7J83_04455 [bacterium]|nr:hypothetical protein [bacterium]